MMRVLARCPVQTLLHGLQTKVTRQPIATRTTSGSLPLIRLAELQRSILEQLSPVSSRGRKDIAAAGRLRSAEL
jgi:hypothetical protein